MTRFFVVALLFSTFVVAPAAAAGEKSDQTKVHADVLEYIAAITKTADENLHSCIADKWESDEDLNADSGITEEDLAALLNPPQS